MTDALRKAIKVFADLGVGSGPDYETETYRIERGAIRNARAALAAAGSNASADARLREAYTAFQNLAADCHRSKWHFDMSEESPPNAYEARRLVRKAFDEVQRIGNIAMHERDALKALSPDPHVSDCEKQGKTTKSEALCPVPPGKNAPVPTRTARDEGGSNLLAHTERRMSDSESIGSLAHDVATSQRENGVSPGPSDRPADVTVEELAQFITDRAPVAYKIARALLDAFTVGRR